jgi:hypothetical protein
MRSEKIRKPRQFDDEMRTCSYCRICRRLCFSDRFGDPSGADLDSRRESEKEMSCSWHEVVSIFVFLSVTQGYKSAVEEVICIVL